MPTLSQLLFYTHTRTTLTYRYWQFHFHCRARLRGTQSDRRRRNELYTLRESSGAAVATSATDRHVPCQPAWTSTSSAASCSCQSVKPLRIASHRQYSSSSSHYLVVDRRRSRQRASALLTSQLPASAAQHLNGQQRSRSRQSASHSNNTYLTVTARPLTFQQYIATSIHYPSAAALTLLVRAEPWWGPRTSSRRNQRKGHRCRSRLISLQLRVHQMPRRFGVILTSDEGVTVLKV